MDIQKTMAFILEQQAKMAVEAQRTDRRVDSIAKLVHLGMKTLVETDLKLNALIDAQIRTDEKMKALIEAQKRTDGKLARTDAKFERLMAALLRKRSNGRR